MRRSRTKGTRSPSAAVDHYLHALLLLTDHGQEADTGDLAARVGVSPAAASQMLRKLADLGLVRLEAYRGAELTTEGLHRALRIVRRHRLLEVFLHEVLHFQLDELHARALAIQPAVDEAFEDRLDELLGHPRVDPHGRPIPGRNATWPKLGDSPLTDVPAGTRGQVSRLLTDNAEAIEYLHGIGIEPGVTLVLEGISPFEGPVAVRVRDTLVHLGRRLAQAVHLEESGKVRRSTQPGFRVVKDGRSRLP